MKAAYRDAAESAVAFYQSILTNAFRPRFAWDFADDGSIRVKPEAMLLSSMKIANFLWPRSREPVLRVPAEPQPGLRETFGNSLLPESGQQQGIFRPVLGW